MRSRRSSLLAHGPSLLALAGGACLTSCNLADNLGDLGGSLLNPDAELLDTPGRQLAAGHYSQLELDGSLESGGWVIAKRHDLDTETVSIVSFLGDGQCELPNASEFRRVSSRIDVALPGLIAYRRPDDDGSPLVDFAGFDCTSRLTPVESDNLPSAPFPRSSPRGLLLLTDAGRLLLVDAVGQELQEIASEVTYGVAELQPGSPGSDRLWLLRGQGETRELVVFDADLERLTAFPGIEQVTLLTGMPEQNAIVADAEGLHFLSLVSETKELIDADGCAPVPLGGRLLAYFSPCSERRLQLSVPGVLVDREEERFTIDVGPDVISAGEILPFWQGADSFLLYLTNPDDASTDVGELRLAERLGDDPADRAEANRGIATNSRLRGSNIYIDWDGTTGTLVKPELTTREDDGTISDFEGLTPVATGVAQILGPDLYSPQGVLIHYDGQVGDLVRFQRSGTGTVHTPLASGVPRQTQALDVTSGLFAFVGDYADGKGTAYLVSGGTARAVGENAIPGTLGFLEQPRALAYLAVDGSTDTAELRAWLIDAELDIRVSERVSEYRELPWPSAGLLYAIPSGDRAGLWFAKAR